MKDCCKTDESDKKSRIKKYFNWIIYLILIAIVVFVLIQNGTKKKFINKKQKIGNYEKFN